MAVRIEDKIFDKCVDTLPPLAGKCIAVTGTTSGTGFHACVAALRKKPAALLLLNRASDRSEKSAAELGRHSSGTVIELVNCDLTSLSSVKRAAGEIARIASSYGGLDVLACNAGVMGFPDQRTEDGFDVQMQTNHLSHFLLAIVLMPSLEAAAAKRGEARIVMHSSGARGKIMAADKVGMLREQYFQKVPPNALGGDGMKESFDRYHQTKLANPVSMIAFHKRLQAGGSKVKCVCAEPGVSATSLSSNLAQSRGAAPGDAAQQASGQQQMYPGIQSAADGACPLILASFASDIVSGDFLMPGDLVMKTVVGWPVKCMSAGVATPPSKWIEKAFEHEKLTLDVGNQELLWKASMEAVSDWLDKAASKL